MKNFEFALNDKGYLTRRESFDLEFKENFHYGDLLYEYARSLIGMANNKGGKIVFGIKDKPRIPVGLKNDKFEHLDTKQMNQIILENFSIDIEWGAETLASPGKTYGILWVKEAEIKPIICRKTHKNILREAAIYFRYRGETKEIRYTELSEILRKEKEKEKLLWMSHIQKIGSIGPASVNILDTFKGELSTTKGTILVDKEILKKIKFIHEGKFVEKDGAPALKLIGNIEGVIEKSDLVFAESAYPLLMSNILLEFKINNYDLQIYLWKNKIKGDIKYHFPVSAGKRSTIHKYSNLIVDKIKADLKRNPNLFKDLRTEYTESKKKEKK